VIFLGAKCLDEEAYPGDAVDDWSGVIEFWVGMFDAVGPRNGTQPLQGVTVAGAEWHPLGIWPG
jgi:hypothetical protein